MFTNKKVFGSKFLFDFRFFFFLYLFLAGREKEFVVCFFVSFVCWKKQKIENRMKKRKRKYFLKHYEGTHINEDQNDRTFFQTTNLWPVGKKMWKPKNKMRVVWNKIKKEQRERFKKSSWYVARSCCLLCVLIKLFHYTVYPEPERYSKSLRQHKTSLCTTAGL